MNQKTKKGFCTVFWNALKKGFFLDEMVKIIEGKRDLRSTKTQVERKYQK